MTGAAGRRQRNGAVQAAILGTAVLDWRLLGPQVWLHGAAQEWCTCHVCMTAHLTWLECGLVTPEVPGLSSIVLDNQKKTKTTHTHTHTKLNKKKWA